METVSASLVRCQKGWQLMVSIIAIIHGYYHRYSAIIESDVDQHIRNNIHTNNSLREVANSSDQQLQHMNLDALWSHISVYAYEEFVKILCDHSDDSPIALTETGDNICDILLKKARDDPNVFVQRVANYDLLNIS